MHLEKFEAHDMAEALAAVKASLGPDAMIVATRELPKRGMWHKRRVEVTAARVDTPGDIIDHAPQQKRKPHHRYHAQHDIPEPLEELLCAPQKQHDHNHLLRASDDFDAQGGAKKTPQGLEDWARKAVFEQLAPLTQELKNIERALCDKAPSERATMQLCKTMSHALKTELSHAFEGHIGEVMSQGVNKQLQSTFDRQLRELKSLMATLTTPGHNAVPLRPKLNSLERHAKATLKQAGVEKDLIDVIVAEAKKYSDVNHNFGRLTQKQRSHEALKHAIARRLATTTPIFELAQHQPKRVALVGPTGVGKTTTIAKLAAHAALKYGLRVALISLDTYRIGATEQIGHYAQLIGVPLRVAYDRASFVDAMDVAKGVDLILIDTAGRSPAGPSHHRDQLTHLFEGLDIDVLFTLGASTRVDEMRAAVEALLPQGGAALVLTKLDEAVALGSALNLVGATRLPLMFVTHGQRVPEDLSAADREALSQRLLDNVAWLNTTSPQKRQTGAKNTGGFHEQVA